MNEVLSEDLSEPLVRLFDLCGFFDSTGTTSIETEFHRLDVLASLKQLLALIKDGRWRDAVRSSSSSGNGFQASSILLDMEGTITHVREQLVNTRNALPRHRDEAIELCRDVESICQELEQAKSHNVTKRKTTNKSIDKDSATNHTSAIIYWTMLARSMTAALLSLLQVEEHALQDAMVALDQLYYTESVSEGHVLGKLQVLSTCLERETLLSTHEFKQALDMLLEQQDAPEAVRQTNVLQNKTENHNMTVSSVANSADSISPGEEEKTSIHRQYASPIVARQPTAEQAIEAFFELPQVKRNALITTMTSILVLGNSGSGKTHLCDLAEGLAHGTDIGKYQSTHKRYKVHAFKSFTDTWFHLMSYRYLVFRINAIVIRPNLPLDIMGSSVGAAEDTIVALFGSVLSEAARNCSRVLLILDGIDCILTSDNQRLTGDLAMGREPHLKRRSQSTFLSMIDGLRSQMELSGENILILCTATADSCEASLQNRFDRIYNLELPTAIERRQIIVDALGLDVAKADHGPWLSEVIESSAGRSRAELSQYCRQAIGNLNEDRRLDEDLSAIVLEHLKNRLVTVTPASLRGGGLDGSVDTRVLSSKDLNSDNYVPSGGQLNQYEFDMVGKSASLAWKELETSVVLPLCRAHELRQLIDVKGMADGKLLTCGALLSGPPGSGKSLISLHCAKYASRLLPTLKLVEVACTSLIHKELGGSEKAIRELFIAARRASPCILVLDGIENIAAVRGNDLTTEGTLDRVLSSLLVELDGVEDRSASMGEMYSYGFAVIGITPNEKLIDPALKRPGRLDRVIRMETDWT